MRRLLSSKWMAVVLLGALAAGAGLHELTAPPAFPLRYPAPEAPGTLFARLEGGERDQLLLATLQHVARQHPGERVRATSRRRMRIAPEGGVRVTDTAAMHDRFRLYLSSLSGKGAVGQLAGAPDDFRVTLRLQLVDPGRFHRERLNQQARLDQACQALSNRLLAEGDRLTPYPGAGAVEITAAVGTIRRIGPLLDELAWEGPPYPSLASLYDTTNTAYHFESAREMVEPASRFWRLPEYQALMARLAEVRPLRARELERLRVFLGTYGKAHYALLAGALLADFQYRSLPDRDPFSDWTADPGAEHLCNLLWMRAVLDASEGRVVEGAGTAAMAIFWADRLERGESPDFLSTPRIRTAGCRAFAAALLDAGPSPEVRRLRDLLGLFALRMSPYEKPWPESRYFARDTADPLERWVNDWRHRQEQRYWQRWRMSQSMLDLLRLRIALELYRAERAEFPAALARLTPEFLPAVPLDALTRRDFLYSTDGLRYRLYTPGFDGVDDGARRRCDPDDPDSRGDWWWEDLP